MSRLSDVDRAARVFSTGAIAKICQCAPRTVAKWFDSGKIKGYRIPGSNDRRVTEGNLLAFLRQYGMAIPMWLLPGEVLVICPDENDVLAVPDGWVTARDEVEGVEALVKGRWSRVVVCDCGIGLSVAVRIANRAAAEPDCVVTLVLSDGVTDPVGLAAGVGVARRPFNWAGVG